MCALTAHYDASVYRVNFIKFGPVTPELTGLFVNVRCDTAKKTVVFSRISPDILDRLSQSFHHVKALYVQMTKLDLIFRFGKGR